MPAIESRRQQIKRQMREVNDRIVTNERELNRAIQEWAELAHKDALDTVVAAFMDCYGRMVIRTPVATGRARAGWHIAGEVDEWKPTPGEYEAAKGNAQAIIDEQLANFQSLVLTDADIIYVMNNVEYILALEAGWSRQSSGFVALFLTELRMKLEEAAEKESRK